MHLFKYMTVEADLVGMCEALKVQFFMFSALPVLLHKRVKSERVKESEKVKSVLKCVRGSAC